MVATSIYVDSNPLAFWGGQVCCHQEFGHCLAMIWSTWRPPLCKPKVQWKKWASYTTSFTPHKKNATTFNLATMWVGHPMSLSGSSQGFSHHPPRPWCYHHHSHLKTVIRLSSSYWRHKLCIHTPFPFWSRWNVIKHYRKLILDCATPSILLGSAL